MEHQFAVDRKLTERYVLGELEAEEREEFEEHYFTCAVCAEDVRIMSELVTNAKAVIREEQG